MTTTPCIEIELISLRMASTAAPSPPSLSPRPTQRPAASAAASVTRTSSSARLRSSSSRLRGTGSVISHFRTEMLRAPYGQPRRCGWCGSRAPVAHNEGVSSGAPTRSGRSAKDIVLSMAVLLVPILLLVAVYRFVYSGDAPVPYDASGVWSSAPHSAPYPVLEPAGLAKGGTVTSA